MLRRSAGALASAAVAGASPPLLAAAARLSRAIASSAAVRSLAAVEKLVKEMEGKRSFPWENNVSQEEACQRLGACTEGTAAGACLPTSLPAARVCVPGRCLPCPRPSAACRPVYPPCR